MTASRLRAALALSASAALLGLTACGGGAPEKESEQPAAPVEQSDGGGASSDDGGFEEEDPQGSSSGASDGGQEAPAASDGGSEAPAPSGGGAGADPGDDEAPAAQGETTRIALVTDLDGGDTESIRQEELSALLAERVGEGASCEGDLSLASAESVPCTGPITPESAEQDADWTATTVQVPNEKGLEHGVRSAVLFTTGDEFPAGAEVLTQGNVSLTGAGMGSMYGSEPLSADEVAEATLEILTADYAYVPLGDMFAGGDVTCEDGLDFSAEYTAVDCTGTMADGSAWNLHVAPGSYVDNDQGLLVGIGSPHDV